MISLNRRDVVAITATLVECASALNSARLHCSLRLEYHPTPATPDVADATARVVADLRERADRAAERKNDGPRSGEVEAVLIDTANTLRSAAGRIEACAREAGIDAGDWFYAVDVCRTECHRLHGQRALMATLFPLK